MAIETFISRVKNLDAKKIIIEAAALNKSELADLNVEQLRGGYLSTGQRTEKYSSKQYEEMKQTMGSKSVPHMDFILEGGFTEGISVKTNNDGILFESTDWKAGKLEQMWGKDLLGVTTDNLESQIDPDVPKVIDKMLMQ